jgi:hypothetical protein
VIGLTGALLGALLASPALAQPPPAASSAPAQDDVTPHPSEPDFKLVALPASLRMPGRAWTFAMTHRFNGNLRAGSFSEQLEGLFGLDSGASIGLELRYAPVHRIQASVFRTNIDRTIQFTAQVDAWRSRSARPLAIMPILAIEGTRNFRDRHQPTVGVIVGHMPSSKLALYASPMWVGRTTDVGPDQSTAMIGLGGRLQLWTRTFLVVEATPRVAGFRPGETMVGVGLEKRVGGHVFQLNVTNTSATTFAQIARGGFPRTLHLGFNLTRKFY